LADQFVQSPEHAIIAAAKNLTQYLANHAGAFYQLPGWISNHIPVKGFSQNNDKPTRIALRYSRGLWRKGWLLKADVLNVGNA
jgi:hypothetical protein